MAKKILLVVAVALLVLPALAEAQGNWIFRVRGINVSPNDSSSEILDTGTHITVASRSSFEIDVTYMFSEHVGLEVIAATTRHDLATSGGALGGRSNPVPVQEPKHALRGLGARGEGGADPGRWRGGVRRLIQIRDRPWGPN